MRRRVVILIFLLVILSGGAVLCIVRWNAWFGNLAEPTYEVPAGPSNVVLTLGADGMTERTISWRTERVVPSCLYLLSPCGGRDTFPAEGSLVCSRAGEAAYYAVRLRELEAGEYRYWVCSGGVKSGVYRFVVPSSGSFRFLLFGDIQEPCNPSPFSEFMSRYEGFDDVAFMAYVGDVIERPIDDYWQVWFRALGPRSGSVAQLPVPGNHEYLKGVRKELDSRWKYVFPLPLNGPNRFLGTSYYVDYPDVRLIFLDTDALQRFSDYTVAQTWLCRTLMESGDRWRIVVMHHPVYSAGAGRDNLMVYTSFRETLNMADVVFAGHDHTYSRRMDRKHIGRHGRTEYCVSPAWIVTGSSSKYYLSKLDTRCQRLGTCRPFYEDVRVTPDTLWVTTRLLENDSVYDMIAVLPDEHILEPDSLLPDSVGLMPEILELPSRYADDSSLRVRRFHNALHSRQGTPACQNCQD